MIPTVLYDDDCGFCERSAKVVRLLRLPVATTPLQDADLPGLGIDPSQAMTQMPFVDETGAVSYGHTAWAQVLQRGVLPLRMAGRLLASRPVEPVAAAVYAWIAANRYRLPGGGSSCALPPNRP